MAKIRKSKLNSLGAVQNVVRMAVPTLYERPEAAADRDWESFLNHASELAWSKICTYNQNRARFDSPDEQEEERSALLDEAIERSWVIFRNRMNARKESSQGMTPEACAASFLRTGAVCGGCNHSSYCGIGERDNQRFAQFVQKAFGAR